MTVCSSKFNLSHEEDDIDRLIEELNMAESVKFVIQN